MTLTIVIVSRKDLSRLGLTLQSIQNSAVPEVVVVHPLDEPGICKFLQDFQPTFKLVHTHDLGQGIYQAMNIGISCASGNHLLFLNCGEILLTDMKHTLRTLKKNQFIHWAILAIEAPWAENKVQNHHDVQSFLNHKESMLLSHHSIVVRKELLDSRDGYDTKYKVAADYDLIHYLNKFSKPHFVFEDIVRIDQPKFASQFRLRGLVESVYITVSFLGLSGISASIRMCLQFFKSK